MRIEKLIIGAVLALVACAGASAPEPDLVVPVAAPLPAGSHEWVELTPRPVELDGRTIEPACSDAPGADPAYKFWARRGAENRLVVFFDGGGACWDDVTCAVPILARTGGRTEGFYKAEILPDDDPRRLGGLLDLNDARNPVRGWSFVFVPYCTGDVHSGSNTVAYRDPDTGERFSIRHRGADNFRIVLEWIRANFAAPEEILVAGSSAGAYGAATHYASIRATYPDARMTMLGDAGQGVTTPDFLERRNSNWRYQLPESVFGSNPQLTSDDDIVGILAARFPNDRFAQYTTAHDRTQAGFFALMGATDACRIWTERMWRDLGRRQSAPNFRSYLAAGASHTILRSPQFYTEQSAGAPFVDWVSALLDDTPPQNRACENCLAPQASCRF